MSMIDELQTLGVNTEEGLGRFMNKASLYERMLGKLPKAVADSETLPCFENGDLQAAEVNAHTLKGVMGNLSVTPLYEGYSEVVRLLREGDPIGARTELERILPIQEKIIACILANA